MNQIGEYLIRVIGSCIVAAVARRILGCSKQFSSLGNMIIGIFVAFSILSPVWNIDWDIGTWQMLSEETDFSVISQNANAYQKDALRASITKQTEAYIWNKAQELSVDIQLELKLQETPPYAPEGVTITGHLSPYAKGQLSQMLARELGIPKEAQVWKTPTS